MTGPTTSWASPSTTTSSPRPWIRCAPAASWPSSPAATPWIPKIPLCASIWPSGRTCWGPSACPTTPSRPTPARRWCRTSCSCKSGAPRRSQSRIGCRPRKRRRASWSTATSSATRRWCWASSHPGAPSMGSRTTPWRPSPARTLPSCSTMRWVISRAAMPGPSRRSWRMGQSPPPRFLPTPV